MNKRTKYAEIEYRNRLWLACKGVLRVKQGESSGMLKTAVDIIPEDYDVIAKALEKAQMKQAYGIPLGRADKKAIEMFNRMPDVAKMKVMKSSDIDLTSYVNNSVNNYGNGTMIGVATGENARASGGPQNNVENNGVMVGSGNQVNYGAGGSGGGGGGGGYGYPAGGYYYYNGAYYPMPPGFVPPGAPGAPPAPGAPADGGAGGAAAKATTKPVAVAGYLHNPYDDSYTVTKEDGTVERLSSEEFKAKYRLGGPEERKALPAPEAGAEEAAKPGDPEAGGGEAAKPGDPEAGKPGGVVDKDGIRTEPVGGGKFKRTFPDGHTEIIDGAGKVISKTDPDGTTTTMDDPTGETVVKDPSGKTTTVAGTTTGDPEKDLKAGGPDEPGGPTDEDYEAMRRTDDRNKFINDYVDRQNERFNKRWSGAGIGAGIAGAATAGATGYAIGDQIAKNYDWDPKSWKGRLARWGLGALGAVGGGLASYYGVKGRERNRRQEGYKRIGGRVYDKFNKPAPEPAAKPGATPKFSTMTPDTDPEPDASIYDYDKTASYNLVKKLRNQVGYRYYSK